eukprot:SAG11_NODE_3032_length_2749_cov_8.088679_2_plen_83_part_00
MGQSACLSVVQPTTSAWIAQDLSEYLISSSSHDLELSRVQRIAHHAAGRHCLHGFSKKIIDTFGFVVQAIDRRNKTHTMPSR